MRTIYKYVLTLTDEQTVEVPAHAEFLTVQMQQEKLCLWAIVEPDNQKEKQYFLIIGTGHDLPPVPRRVLQYIGTVQQESGFLVWHVFRVVR